jgi:hypothetical protein
MTAHYSMAGNTSLAGMGKTLVAKTFDQRLDDFSPELAAFLREAWVQRIAVAGGKKDLYDIYTGEASAQKVRFEELTGFLSRMKAIHRAGSIDVQDFPRAREFTPLSELSDSQIKLHRHALARRFYHCMNAPGSAFSRIYVHARNLQAGLDILQEVVGYFPRMPGIKEAKIVGPALIDRADTIVIYFQTQQASDELFAKLLELQKRFPGAFTAGVPALVKEVAPGVGTSNEPPKFEILPGGGTLHSFGTFYCDLIFTALQQTPNVHSAIADGRHMLDNLLWSLRMLGIDPKDHLAFPQRAKLEAYQQALGQKPAAAV